MFTITINVPSDVLAAGNGSVAVAMYGQLLVAYTPTSGPSSGTLLPVYQWVYFTGSDYAAVTAPVTAFATYTAAGAQSVSLPDVFIQASHIVFGIGTLPVISQDASGAPQQPSTATTTTIYDFVEFTYNASGVLFINTTMIDQFGFPIRIQLTPPAAPLPQGAGVTIARNEVFSQFGSYATGANADFVQCAQDPFGNALTTRILSPGDALNDSTVQGVTASVGTAPPSTLAAGLYYYAVTAVGTGPRESYPQPIVVQGNAAANDAVTISWAPNAAQPGGIISYNIYRGTAVNGVVSWGLIGNVPASNFGPGIGGAFSDTGQTATAQAPPVNAMATLFDGELATFFQTYATKTLTLTATDGTTDGYVYTFQGTVSGNALQLLLTGVADVNGNAVQQTAIPLQTPFNVYYPFWSSNTFNSSNPAPPSWALYTNVPASVMVFAAEGVFADNAVQPVPSGVTDADIYSTLLGALENQIVAAITRGIANLPALSPQNWGNGTAPTQVAPTLTPAASSLAPGTYYYVVTAVNANGESIASLEFNATTTAAQPSVQVNWQPLVVATAASFNVYRGTASMQENTLAGSKKNDGTTSSLVDSGGGSSQVPPAYFPAGVPASGYDSFFHQPSISLNGAAYAGPYDDQGGQSSTLAVANPTAVSITLGPW
jgi:hypothetical protein